MSIARKKRPSLPPSMGKQEATEPVVEEEVASIPDTGVAAEAASIPEEQPNVAEEAASIPEESSAAAEPKAKVPPSRERDVHIAIMDETFVLIDTIYRSRHTLLDILSVRGYDVDRYRKFSPAEAAEATVGSAFNGLSFTVSKRDNPEHTCQVYYGLTSLSKAQNVTAEIADDAAEHTEVIVMQQTPVTERHHIAAFQDYNRSKATGGPRKTRISFFCIDNLVINPLNHVMVPKHEIVPEEEHKALLTSLYATSKSKLPEIKYHVDPIARCIGAKPGDIVKITRPSTSAGEAIIYRVCSR